MPPSQTTLLESGVVSVVEGLSGGLRNAVIA